MLQGETKLNGVQRDGENILDKVSGKASLILGQSEPSEDLRKSVPGREKASAYVLILFRYSQII